MRTFFDRDKPEMSDDDVRQDILSSAFGFSLLSGTFSERQIRIIDGLKAEGLLSDTLRLTDKGIKSVVTFAATRPVVKA